MSKRQRTKRDCTPHPHHCMITRKKTRDAKPYVPDGNPSLIDNTSNKDRFSKKNNVGIHPETKRGEYQEKDIGTFPTPEVNESVETIDHEQTTEQTPASENEKQETDIEMKKTRKEKTLETEGCSEDVMDSRRKQDHQKDKTHAQKDQDSDSEIETGTFPIPELNQNFETIDEDYTTEQTPASKDFKDVCSKKEDQEKDMNMEKIKKRTFETEQCSEEVRDDSRRKRKLKKHKKHEYRKQESDLEKDSGTLSLPDLNESVGTMDHGQTPAPKDLKGVCGKKEKREETYIQMEKTRKERTLETEECSEEVRDSRRKRKLKKHKKHTYRKRESDSEKETGTLSLPDLNESVETMDHGQTPAPKDLRGVCGKKEKREETYIQMEKTRKERTLETEECSEEVRDSRRKRKLKKHKKHAYRKRESDSVKDTGTLSLPDLNESVETMDHGQTPAPKDLRGVCGKNEKREETYMQMEKTRKERTLETEECSEEVRDSRRKRKLKKHKKHAYRKRESDSEKDTGTLSLPDLNESVETMDHEQVTKQNRTKKSEMDANQHISKQFFEFVDINESVPENLEFNHGISEQFHFEVTKDTWTTIKPYDKTYSNGRTIRRMNGNWTSVLQTEINKNHPGCVLCFKTHHVKSKKSRKISGPFLLATAFCKGMECGAKFKFWIEEEPNLETDSIIVSCIIHGVVNHSDEEVNRRNITGKHRDMMGSEIKKKSAAKVFYDNVLSSDTTQLSAGNYTNVPNQTVLRKIVSEILKKEQLHSNILAELQVLKESYEKSNEPYIREIGYDPFYLIMFSDTQIQLLKSLSEKDELYVYLDATGSVISNIAGQKRPFLYSFVVKPNPDYPPVSLADMISTQHTIPRIQLYLSQIKRCVNITGKALKIKKIETDYSLALVQACLHTFNKMSIKDYLNKCMEILKSKTVPTDFTVHHLCAAHMLKDFSRQLTKCKPTIKSKIRNFVLNCFALLQNSTSLSETLGLYKLVCNVLCKSKLSKVVEDSTQQLLRQIKSSDLPVDADEDDIFMDESSSEKCSDDKTIKQASPFTEIFTKITTDIQSSEESEGARDDNGLYCPEALQCLLDKFMPILPLWSGVILSTCELNPEDTAKETIISRDTTSAAENWFKFIKCDLKTPKHARPYVFVCTLRQAIESRLKEHLFPGCRKKKSKSKQKKDCNPTLAAKEEIWKPKRKKGVYHSKTRFKPVAKNCTSNLPKVMKWGGQVGKTVLANTCTIDNVLTILHIKYACDSNFKSHMENDPNPLTKTLLTVFKLMSEEQFAAAKVIWVNFTGKQLKSTTNLYGDEYDFIVSYIDRQWTSTTVTTCDSRHCHEPRKESEEHRGLVVSISTPFHSLQCLVDKWLTDTAKCTEYLSDFENSPDKNEPKCPGTRTVKRRVLQYPPILVIRVYEHCLLDRLTLSQILHNEEVTLKEQRYCLAGLTLHKSDHYTAIVSVYDGPLWYDGLIGKLQALPKNIDNWFPSHVFLVRK